MDLGLDKVQGGLDKLGKLPRAYRLALLPALAAIVIGAYFYLFYGGTRTELEGLRAQQMELQRKLNEVRAVAANLSSFEEELSKLEMELTVAVRQLPNSKELPGLLTDISSAGKNAGLEFKSFKPKDEIPREFYAEVPIEIAFTGGFHEVATFFDALAKLPRIVNVSELEMKIASETPDGTVLDVHGAATTFRFIEAAAAPPAPAGRKAPQKAPAKAQGGEA
jgi:type IV pilus assembly protein PilO